MQQFKLRQYYCPMEFACPCNLLIISVEKANYTDYTKVIIPDWKHRTQNILTLICSLTVSVLTICIYKKHECCWPLAIKVQICSSSTSFLGSVSSSGMSEDFPLGSFLLSSCSLLQSVSNRKDNSSCITKKSTAKVYFLILPHTQWKCKQH